MTVLFLHEPLWTSSRLFFKLKKSATLFQKEQCSWKKSANGLTLLRDTLKGCSPKTYNFTYLEAKHQEQFPFRAAYPSVRGCVLSANKQQSENQSDSGIYTTRRVSANRLIKNPFRVLQTSLSIFIGLFSFK